MNTTFADKHDDRVDAETYVVEDSDGNGVGDGNSYAADGIDYQDKRDAIYENIMLSRVVVTVSVAAFRTSTH